MPFAERRRCARVPVHSKASLQVRGVEHSGVVVDISLWGALFAARADFTAPIDRDCHLSLVDAADRLTIALAGVIVHSEDRQSGILFRALDSKAVRGLKRITETRLSTAALLHRSLPALLRRR